MPKPVTPLLTVDGVLFDAAGRLLLIRRKHPPFEGQWALPGGFVDVGETVEAACARELAEETGLAIDPADLTLVGVFSDPARDPRGHTASAAFTATLADAPVPQAGDDAAHAEWRADWRDLPLGFDHAQIIARAVSLLSQM